ncbi:MAG: DUF445 domain-containing protein [Bacteroidia bacterium]|nr:DUF445 domain-containing protein [Bacteroidia bacterium]MCX7652498.1 DUF445 domain-containing protein [Bacteroidia bacterium]MDW8416679.1 DUF445 family protein [Bacteroidia bacterium]
MRQLLERYLTRHFHLDEVLTLETLPTPTAAPPLRLRYRIMARLLRYAPHFLGVIVIVHLINQRWALLPAEYEEWYQVGYVLAVTGLVGYGTNWLAIKMLFHPRKPRPIWGQGLVPAYKMRIVERFSEAISRYILNEDVLQRVLHEAGVAQKLAQALTQGTSNLLNDPEFRTEVTQAGKKTLQRLVEDPVHQRRLIQVIDARLLQVVPAGIAGSLFRSYRQLNEKGYREVLARTVLSIPDAFEEAMRELKPPEAEVRAAILAHTDELEALLTDVIRSIISRIPLHPIIYNQLAAFDERQLERLFLYTTSEHLEFIQNLGALLGVLAGVFIMNPWLSLVGAATTIGGLWILDELLYRWQNRQRA